MAKFELFGTAGCPYTGEVRDWLELRRFEFEEYDVEKDPRARERMRELASGQRTVPILAGGPSRFARARLHRRVAREVHPRAAPTASPASAGRRSKEVFVGTPRIGGLPAGSSRVQDWEVEGASI